MAIAELELPHCRSCGASIYWLKNDTTGKSAPIDVRPDPDGPVIIAAEGGVQRYHVLTKAEEGDAGVALQRYTNHFQTCPNAAKHKKS